MAPLHSDSVAVFAAFVLVSCASPGASDASVQHAKRAILPAISTTIEPPPPSQSTVDSGLVSVDSGSMIDSSETPWPAPWNRLVFEVSGGYVEVWPPVHPPLQGGAPVSVYFHGLSASAAAECPVAWAATEHGWLVCPDGNVPYCPGGFAWNHRGSNGRVAGAIEALKKEHGEFVEATQGLLIGYSHGAVAAWHQLAHGTESWLALVLINTGFRVNASVFKAKGIARVAFVAGQHDGSRGVMAESARALERQGIDARLFVLEETGHYFDQETWKKMGVPLHWAFTGWEKEK